MPPANAISLFTARGASPRVALATKWRMTQTDADSAQETKLSSAEKTRRELSKDKPMVKFRREFVEEENNGFTYTSGVKQGGVDIWLITGLLVILVPAAFLVWGIQTGLIDVNPR